LWRAIYDAIWAHVASLGPVHADAVTVGVFLLRDRKLAEIRPKARSLSLELVLPRSVSDARVARRIRTSADRVVHLIRLTSPAEVDATVRDWLTEAYDAAGAGA
jgi:hypothetical protein